MKLLEKKRDELAEKHAKHPIQDNHASIIYGFDAALNELEPVLKELVSDMQYMAADDIDIVDVPSEVRSYILRARKAIQKYKQLTGEK